MNFKRQYSDWHFVEHWPVISDTENNNLTRVEITVEVFLGTYNGPTITENENY